MLKENVIIEANTETENERPRVDPFLYAATYEAAAAPIIGMSNAVRAFKYCPEDKTHKRQKRTTANPQTIPHKSALSGR
jgi:peptide deformylase